MRMIFIFFVMLNLLFFVWQSNGFNGNAAVSAKSLTKIPANIDKLVLISEASAAKNAAEKAKKKQKAKKDKVSSEKAKSEKLTVASLAAPLPRQTRSARSYNCYSMGPFKVLSQASPIALKLRDLGVITNNRRQETQVPTGYWVYLPKMGSWQDARKKVMSLEVKGMKDLFIMGRGTMKNAVSAGLFTSEKSARSRISRLVDLGENPQLQTQYSKTPEYWIDIDVEEGKKQVVSAIEAIAKSLTLLELVSRRCQ